MEDGVILVMFAVLLILIEIVYRLLLRRMAEKEAAYKAGVGDGFYRASRPRIREIIQEDKDYQGELDHGLPPLNFYRSVHQFKHGDDYEQRSDKDSAPGS